MVTIKSRLASRQVVSVFLFCVTLSISVTKNLRQTTQTRWTVKACFWSMVSVLGYLSGHIAMDLWQHNES